MPLLIVGVILWIGISNELKRGRSQRLTLERGEELVACVVQSPDELSKPGSSSTPVQVLLSFAGADQATPEQLRALAARAAQLVFATPTSEAERDVVEIVRDWRYRPEVRHKLLTEFTGGLGVWVCQVVIHQAKLPERRLTGPFVRVKALPGEDGWVWMSETQA